MRTGPGTGVRAVTRGNDVSAGPVPPPPPSSPPPPHGAVPGWPPSAAAPSATPGPVPVWQTPTVTTVPLTPQGRRLSKSPRPAVAAAVLVVLAVAGAVLVITRQSATGHTAPLSLADLHGILTSPPGWSPVPINDNDPTNGDTLCSTQRTLPPNNPTNSVEVSTEASAQGPANDQGIQVFPTAAAAQAYAQAWGAGVPCFMPTGKIVIQFTARARHGSYTGTAGAASAFSAVLDVVAVRNVVYFSVDVSAVGPVDVVAHDRTTDKVLSALRAK